jgi:predicted transcriptional regulator YheO
MRAKTLDDIRRFISYFAADRGMTPLSLESDAKRELVNALNTEGFMNVKKSVQAVSEALAVSRATIYNYLKKESHGNHA